MKGSQISPLLPGVTPVRRRPPLDLSVTGVVYGTMMAFMGLAAANSQANLLFGVFGLMIGIGLISYGINRLVLRKIAVERVLPEHAVVGRHCVFTYQIRNNKRFWPSFSVTVAELDAVDAFTRQPQAYLLHAAARMTAVVPCEVVPRRRGLHLFEQYQVSTSFPFGFIKRAETRRQRETLLVYPALAEVHPRVLAMARSAEDTGAQMRPRRGGNDEFYGLKEHRAGESTRWIYWRRSARTGTLVSKEMTHVAPPKLMILLDTFMQADDPATVEVIELAIAMAASLASVALDAGLPVGMATWSDQPVQIAPNRGKRHCRDLLTLLARLPVNREQDVSQLLQATAEYRRAGTTTFLITPRDVPLTLGEHARGGTIVLSPISEQARSLFKFDPMIDFSRSAPEEAALLRRGQAQPEAILR
jgi:uncharacterized protein (DUF58 family)